MQHQEHYTTNTNTAGNLTSDSGSPQRTTVDATGRPFPLTVSRDANDTFSPSPGNRSRWMGKSRTPMHYHDDDPSSGEDDDGEDGDSQYDRTNVTRDGTFDEGDGDFSLNLPPQGRHWDASELGGLP